MSALQRQLLLWSLALLLIAGCTWLWFDYFEKRWEARAYTSDAARKNSMLAATRLLQQHQQPVTGSGTLAELPLASLPGGTLILTENNGIVTATQSAQLLAWVRRGNTLIVRPKWSGQLRKLACGVPQVNNPPATTKPQSGNNVIDADPISTYLGVRLVNRLRQSQETAPTPALDLASGAPVSVPCVAHLTLRDSSYPLQLDSDRTALQSTANSVGNLTDSQRMPLWGDDTLEAVRVYQVGTGHIAVLAANYFDNRQLALYDHAALLLALVQLKPGKQQLTIVQHLDMPSWYQALWWNFKYGIIGLICSLLLLLWMNVRRFGPLLPEPDQTRRSLLEHIDASGRWLWKIPDGRELLLSAVRDASNKILVRKVPQLSGMSAPDQIDFLAGQTQLARTDIQSAWLGRASKQPQHFTRQIQTLQQLRNHYER